MRSVYFELKFSLCHAGEVRLLDRVNPTINISGRAAYVKKMDPYVYATSRALPLILEIVRTT